VGAWTFRGQAYELVGVETALLVHGDVSVTSVVDHIDVRHGSFMLSHLK
jgi:hypothetical protein